MTVKPRGPTVLFPPVKLTEFVGQWSRRLLELVAVTDAEAAQAALRLVGDPELVDAIDGARRLGGQEAVKELLDGVSVMRVVRAAKDLAAAVEDPEVAELLAKGKHGNLAELVGIDTQKLTDAVGRLAALTPAQLAAAGAAITSPMGASLPPPPPAPEGRAEEPKASGDGQA